MAPDWRRATLLVRPLRLRLQLRRFSSHCIVSIVIVIVIVRKTKPSDPYDVDWLIFANQPSCNKRKVKPQWFQILSSLIAKITETNETWLFFFYLFFVSVLSQTCRGADGTIYDVGDEWRPDPFTVCRCAAPSSIECALSLRCIDHQGNLRDPGEQWLPNPTTSCTCNQFHLVACVILEEPACMDISGSLRKNGETWTNGSCVHCTCINGTISCTGYNVKITYGLYSVQLFPTCEKCDLPSRTQDTLSACKGR